VESYYLLAGFLLPAFHKVYWLGLDSGNRTWPTFRWMDRSLPALADGSGTANRTYTHWGKTDGIPEPNSRVNCSVADGAGAFAGAWGWNDYQCSNTAIFMCRKISTAGYYLTASNGLTYIFNATPLAFDAAEASCRSAGGHLASYRSWKEQAEVRCSAAQDCLAGVDILTL
jgi:hypothetical protein